MSDKKPVIKILRSSKDEFVGAYPNYSTDHQQSEEIKSKATACGNTGIRNSSTEKKVKN